jgi:hypothetical protein
MPDRFSFDVCVNSDSICQLGQSVLFATDHGLSIVTESDVNPASAVLDGPVFNASTTLGITSTVAALQALLAFTTHPHAFFKTAKLLYDSTNSRVIVLSTATGSVCAYVFSMKDAAWSTMYLGDCLAIANGYPYPYLQRTDGSTLRLDKNFDYTSLVATPALVVTRTLTYADTMQVIQCFQQFNDCASVPLLSIYGSNDNISWQLVGTVHRNYAPYLPGRPFRFFRICLQLSMTGKEKYSKLMLDVIEKYQKL